MLAFAWAGTCGPKTDRPSACWRSVLRAFHAASRAAWSTELNRVRVTGDGERERLLYTHLFRVMQTPVRIDDVNGR